MRALKTYTSNQIQNQIAKNPVESRKEYLLKMFKESALNSSNVKHGQFWQQNNKPIEIWTDKVINQKIEYIHMNPVAAGFVDQPEDWLYSSARNFAGRKGKLCLSEL